MAKRVQEAKAEKMKTEYPFSEIESKWQKKWEESGAHRLDMDDNSSKYYCLTMFIYPSAQKLHVGHWYCYGPTDSWARYKKMRGLRVFEPMGYDAFGLPAENYAIDKGVHPAKSTAENVSHIREQLKAIGAMYDWSKEINTSSPEYYRWTQWLFLQLYKKGLAYRKLSAVNWCPKCLTVLANEQVVEGDCERCGMRVIKKDMKQWFFKITDYADRLLEGLEDIDWPEKTRIMQKNWIGRSEGAEIKFTVAGNNNVINVFTTRADTLFGATYMVLAPEHPLVDELTTDERREDVRKYIEKTQQESEIERTSMVKEKTGVFTGSFAVNPVNGEKIPVWISDYVLLSYGTGAVMAVPGHDERDFDFAGKFSLEIRKVILGDGQSESDELEKAYTGEGKMINSGEFSGVDSKEGREKVVEYLRDRGSAEFAVNYKLRDWLVSRQRYWGAPIPIVYCPGCGEVPVPEDSLPVLLPEEVDFLPGEKGRSPLDTAPEFVSTKCPDCGSPARREVDTMDTFVCSSWYYLRYPDPGYGKGPFNPGLVRNWLPVDHYVGGAEHAVMHLLYARFITKVLHDLNFINFDEPFLKLVHQGTITNQGAKMSKSRGNVVNPDVFIEKFGSDTFRMYLMFTGPYEEGGDWSDKGINGISRFLGRVWRLVTETGAGEGATADLRSLMRNEHKTVRKVTQDIERLHFNTAISAIMEYVNYLTETRDRIDKKHWREAIRILILLLAPFAPHMCEELWERTVGKESVFCESWPSYDEETAKEEEITLIIQINGKLRQKLTVSVDLPQDELEKIAIGNERIKQLVEGKEIKKVIVVPGKLVNIVT